MNRNWCECQLKIYLVALYLMRYLCYLKHLDLQSKIEKNPPSEASSTTNINPTVDNELLYQGRRYDSESNLYYYRARYYDPIMGRFLSTDPLGYKDSMNLYQGFNMNRINFVDPMGLFKIIEPWIAGSAQIFVEPGDSQAGLAKLLPGISLNDVKNVIPNFTQSGANTTINVYPLISIFKERVQGNIVMNALKANSKFGLSFSAKKTRTLAALDETQIREVFNSSNSSIYGGCLLGSGIIQSKGLIDTLNPGEYDQLFIEGSIINSTSYKNGEKTPINEIEVGDQIHFINKNDPPNVFYKLKARAEQAEWVVKVGSDLYFGFGYGNGNSLDTYQGWRERLAGAYNKFSLNKIEGKDVPGVLWHF